MNLLYLAGIVAIIVMNSLAAIFFVSLSFTRIGISCNYKETMKWKAVTFFFGFFLTLCLIEVIGYLVLQQRTVVPESITPQQAVPSQPVASASLPVSSVLPNETPQTSSIKIIGHAEHRQGMSEEIDHQRKAIEKLYALSEELKRKIYIIPDDSSIEGLPDEPKREKVLPESIKSDSAKLAKARELDRQRHADEVKKQEEIELSRNRKRYNRRQIEAGEQQFDRIAEKKIRDVAPNESHYHQLPDSTMLCNEIQRQIDAKIRNQAVFNNPIGQPTFLKGPRGILIITPEARKGNCIEYDIQIGEGNNPAHCRNTACMSLQ